MSDAVITVDGVGKKYRLGARSGQYKSLRESLRGTALAPVRLGRRVVGASSPEDVGQRPDFWAVRDVGFDVQRGEVLGIIGRNGAGKSTMLKILSRITEPTEGEVRIKGRVAALLEVGTGFNPELSGRDNVYLNGAILGMTRSEIKRKFDEIVAFAQVEEFIDTQVKKFSSGMYLRLAFSVAAHLQPEILIVDEVLAVGDVAFQRKCLGKMSEVARQGRTVVFVSHNMAAVKRLCSKAILLESGRVVASGEPEAMAQSYERQGVELATSPSAFPVVDEESGVSVTACDVRLEDTDGGWTLAVEVGVEAVKMIRALGVGLLVTSTMGVEVSVLAPVVTNFVLEDFQGAALCAFACQDVQVFLAGGDYVVGVFLGGPGGPLLTIREAGIVSIPARDLFGTGRYFDARLWGPVPLPVTFSVDGALRGGPVRPNG